MRLATICLLLKQNGTGTPGEILLGHKKDGMGAGKIAGFGGGVEPGERIVDAAVREMFEESSVTVQIEDAVHMAHLVFTFPTNPTWDHDVHVYTVLRWSGTPTESDEMIPQWFTVADIPYPQMWSDASHWLPYVLRGEFIEAYYSFKADLETIVSIEMINVHPVTYGAKLRASSIAISDHSHKRCGL